MTCDFVPAELLTTLYSFVYPISLTWLVLTRGMVFQALSKGATRWVRLPGQFNQEFTFLKN